MGVSPEFWFNLGLAISSCLGGIFTGVAYSFVRKRLAEKKEAEEIGLNARGSLFQHKHTVVHETLTSLRIRAGADRARIGYFHNGGRFLDGQAMKKLSITHESCERGVVYDGANFQNILVTVFWDLVESMRMDEPKIHLSSEMREGYFRSYNHSNGIHAYSILPIKKGDLFAGFIVLDWFDGSRIPGADSSFPELFIDSRNYIELEMAMR